ncbi:MAG TPA: hypothetical protein VFS59_16815 [Gemmatimonadaceae bacterium]|nr:hypothetical protein [Gemmatimonadaceae bacterium]
MRDVPIAFFRLMPLIRRIAALASSLLLLQLTLLEAGDVCGSRAHRDGRTATMPAAHPSHAQSSPTPADDCDARHPPGACVSMPSCASPAVPPPAVVLRAALASPPGVLPEPIALASHAAVGPDVPPPRG